MARVRSSGGTALKGGKVMVKTNSNKGARKIRCPGCKMLMGPSMDGQGKPVYKCSCGRTLRSTAM